MHPRDLCGEGPSSCQSPARRKVKYSCSNIILCLSLQPGTGMRLILHSASSVDFCVVSHFELLCGEAEATSCATKIKSELSVYSMWGKVGQTYCCSPPTPRKTEGLLHTRTSIPADVPAEAGSSNLNSWAGASLKKNAIFSYSFSNFLWHEK